MKLKRIYPCDGSVLFLKSSFFFFFVSRKKESEKSIFILLENFCLKRRWKLDNYNPFEIFLWREKYFSLVLIRMIHHRINFSFRSYFLPLTYSIASLYERKIWRRKKKREKKRRKRERKLYFQYFFIIT